MKKELEIIELGSFREQERESENELEQKPFLSLSSYLSVVLKGSLRSKLTEEARRAKTDVHME